jgi:hypothetical protein
MRNYDFVDDPLRELEEAYDRIRQLENKAIDGHWYSVSDCLPQYGEFVWVFTKPTEDDDGVELAYYANGFYTADSAGGREGLNSETLIPTHWQYLHTPEAP